MSIVQGKMEELQELDGLQQVDVIVSEWMGYALLFETMLDTVGGGLAAACYGLWAPWRAGMGGCVARHGGWGRSGEWLHDGCIVGG